MKTPKIRSALVISALALPLAAWGQTSGTTGTTGSQTGQTSQAQQSQYDQQHRDMQQRQTDESWRQQPSTTTSTSAATSASTTGSFAASGDIKRVEREELDNRLTASDLIGKDVVGSDGEKIGTVKDISLAGVLQSSFEHRGSAAVSADDPTGASSMDASTRAGSTLSAAASDASKDVIVYVAVGGVMGVGGDLVSVPASELRFDQQSEEVRIDRPSTEITAIASADDDDTRVPAVAE